MLTSGGGGVKRLKEKGFGAVFIESGKRVECGRVRKRFGRSVRIETDDGMLLVRFPEKGHGLSILAEGVLVNVFQGVQMSVAEMINGHGCALVFLRLFDERRIDGSKSELIRCMKSELERFDIRIFGDSSTSKIDNGEGILRQLVSRKFPDPGLPGFPEFRFDEADGVSVIVQDPGPVSAGNGDDV